MRNYFFQSMTNIPKTLESKWAIHAHGKMKNLYRLPHLLKKDEKMEFLQNFTTEFNL